MTLVLTALDEFPLVSPGDDLVRIIHTCLSKGDQTLVDGDILVITQKIVSKAENRLVNLTEVSPSKKSKIISQQCDKDARVIELILRESNNILRIRPGTIIVEHRLGFICANAGIDHSNVSGPYGHQGDWVLLLPLNPDESAQRIKSGLEQIYQSNIGVLIIDSHGRAWRNGVVGTTIGLAGVPGVVDLRGKPDLFNYSLRVTQVAVADELAGAASLIMGQADEAKPVIHIRGFPYAMRESRLEELLRDKDKDLFR